MAHPGGKNSHFLIWLELIGDLPITGLLVEYFLCCLRPIRRYQRWFSLFALLLVTATWVGCDPYRSEQEDATRRSLPPLPGAVAWDGVWKDSRHAWIETALSPALLLHSQSREIRIFVPEAGRTNTVPQYLAFGANGPKLVTNGIPVHIEKMQERWLLVWFGGVAGWEKQECPIGIFLQNPLQSLELNSTGLTLRFAGAAGDLTLMPLYGARPLPVSPTDLAALPISREERRKLPRVWEWTKSVPRDPLTRLRYWSSALAQFPYAAWGCWTHDAPKSEVVRFYTGFTRYPIPFSWTISPLILSPIPHSVAESSRLKSSPIVVDRTVFDMDWPELGHPLFAVPEFDSYAIEKAGGATGTAELKQTLAPLLHLGETVAGEHTPQSEGWREWMFDPQFEAKPESRVFRFDPARSQLIWTRTNGMGMVQQPLGEVWFDGARQPKWDTMPINRNTRVIRSLATP
mgnify:CR=1 FL=1